MSFQESPAQRSARAGRDAFFGRPPLFGPALPSQAQVRQQSGTRLRENPADAARRSFRESFFEPRIEAASAVKAETDKSSFFPPKEAKISAKTGGKTKNEARDSGGTLIVKDCEGTELFRIPGLSGIDGEQELRAGCDDSSSGSVGT